MIVSEQIISVLDYMGEKLGMAIDWTAENVMPQVTEFMGRYQMYAIIEHTMWTIIFVIGIAILEIIIKKMFKGIATEDYNNIWYDMHWNTDGALTYTVVIVLGLTIAVFVYLAIANVFNIARWALIPEIQFFETFSECLKSA